MDTATEQHAGEHATQDDASIAPHDDASFDDAEQYAAANTAEQQQQAVPQHQIGHVNASEKMQDWRSAGEIRATAEQSAAAEAGQLKLLDVQMTAHKFWSSLQPDRLSYVQHLAALAPVSKLATPDQGTKLPPNVQPSILQQKLCCGANTLSSTLLPVPTVDGLSLYNQPINGGSNPQQQPHLPQQRQAVSFSYKSSTDHVWQFNFGLLRATHVGPTGFRGQYEPLYHVARIAIFDKARGRFLGNIHTVPPTEVRSKGLTWIWGPEGTGKTLTGFDKPRPDPVPPGDLAGSPAAAAAAVASAGLLGGLADVLQDHSSLGGAYAGAGGANTFVVRCAKEALDPVHGLAIIDDERLSMYIELNVSFRLTATDAAVVPQAEHKGAGLVTEPTTCWSLVSLKRCAELTREMDINVPLYTGSIYQPGLLAALWEAHRKLHPVRSIFTSAPTPQLSFRVGPLQATPPPLLPYNAMPSTFMARRSVAYLLAAARLGISQQLAAAAAASHNQQLPASQAAGAGGMVGVVQGFSDAALAAAPALLDDPLLLDELVARWWGRCKGLVAAAEQQSQADCLLASCSSVNTSSPPSQDQLITALKTSILEVSPLLHCSTMAADHMTNFLEHQQRRAQVAASFLRRLDPKTGRQMSAAAGGGARHPVEVLSGMSSEFLHKPFDVSEVRVCIGDQIQAARWSRC